VLETYDGKAITNILGIHDGVTHTQMDVYGKKMVFDRGLNLKMSSLQLMKIDGGVFLGK